MWLVRIASTFGPLWRHIIRAQLSAGWSPDRPPSDRPVVHLFHNNFQSWRARFGSVRPNPQTDKGPNIFSVFFFLFCFFIIYDLDAVSAGKLKYTWYVRTVIQLPLQPTHAHTLFKWGPTCLRLCLCECLWARYVTATYACPVIFSFKLV